jgi:hypothetical protein
MHFLNQKWWLPRVFKIRNGHQAFLGLVILEKNLTPQGMFYIKNHGKCLVGCLAFFGL